jgi:hypothetical protein
LNDEKAARARHDAMRGLKVRDIQQLTR